MVDLDELRIEGNDFAKAASENADETDKRDMLLVLAGFQIAKKVNKVIDKDDKPDKVG